jgi:biopolymer transport protein ExbD
MKVLDDIRKEGAELDMTPMIDVVFLLIIFFMVVTEMSKRENEAVNLPRATQTIEDVNAPKSRIVVNVTYTAPTEINPRVVSNIIINGDKYNDQDGLIGYLKGRAAQAGKSADGIASELAVKIRADGHCEYQKVQRVMVACMKAGIAKVAFGAAPKDPK